MFDGLHAAATGLEAQQENINRLANDIANVNTDGYKRSRTEFSDLMYKNIKDPGAAVGETSITPAGIQTGMGVKVAASHKIFEQGPMKNTGNPLDVMIEGRGFFVVQKPNGEIAYTRSGTFHRDAAGRVGMSNGSLLVPSITIPPNSVSVTISSNGSVKAQLPGNQEADLGQIQLAQFVNESGLKALGENLFQSTLASGVAQQAVPGEDGLGGLMQGAIEASNVNPATAMIDMITTQRAFELNTKVLNVTDKLLEATTNIK